MKTIKIFSLPSHATKERTSGVDFARIIQPSKHLNGYADREARFEVDVYDPNEEELHAQPAEWMKIAKSYGIIYFNYLNNPWGFAAMGAMARANGVKLVMDLDDSLWNISPDNPAYEVYKKGGQAIRDFISICNEVDYITCTNDYLKHVIMNNTKKTADKIKVFPNYIDLNLYSHRSPFKDDRQIRLMHFGSTTHFIDLADSEFRKGIDRIMTEYPNVTVKMIGAFQADFKNKWGARYETAYGDTDIYKWIDGRFREYLDECDILVVPLIDNIYNRCKSPIKFLEASSAKKPGVWQDIRQYQEVVDHGKNGFLAKKASGWYRLIKTLIDDTDKRRKMGEAAFKTIEDNWTIQEHVPDYASFFKSIIDK